jgi:hypothetical protein
MAMTIEISTMTWIIAYVCGLFLVAAAWLLALPVVLGLLFVVGYVTDRAITWIDPK